MAVAYGVSCVVELFIDAYCRIPNDNKQVLGVSIINILDVFAGSKTYVLGVATIVFGVAGWITGGLPQSEAIVAILAGLGLITGRRAVSR